MKAVPKVGLDGLNIEDVLVDDSFYGVVPIYAQPEPEEAPELSEDGEISEEEPDVPEEPEPEHPREIIGYVVGIPLPSGLYHPRFDLVAWEAFVDEEREALAEYNVAVEKAWRDCQEALDAWDEQGEPPELIYPDKPMFSITASDFWVEGLTPEEIAELRKPGEQTEVEKLKLENEALKKLIEDKDRENKNALFEIYSILLGG